MLIVARIVRRIANACFYTFVIVAFPFLYLPLLLWEWLGDSRSDD